ncbi:hypothetical protein J4419_03945 [Candidatus Woesearchaeota archaeon]|nr:hypothetical protein [Candidatus Woesearchaeota archaeon]
MRHDLAEFRKAVGRYKKKLSNVKGSCLIMLVPSKEAFYSVAPLSLALHELGCDVRVELKSHNLAEMKKFWTLYFAMKSGLKNEKTSALKRFLLLSDRKCEGKLAPLFQSPDIFLNSGKAGFVGTRELPYEIRWRREPQESLLKKTAARIWDHVYDLKKKDKIGLTFELVHPSGAYPLDDYLDSYRIAWAMFECVKERVISLSASTPRKSQLDEPDLIGDFKATLLGLELSKHSKEPVFWAYTKLSRLLGISWEFPSATFAIHGDGYSGRHYFGECVGYPSPNGKTRWQSPGQILYKLDYFPQTLLDPRKPRTRTAFTSTIPVPIFIKSCYVDWLKMAKKNRKIMRILDSSEYVVAEGRKFGKYETKLKIRLTKGEGRRYSRGSDVATRDLIRKDFYKRTGKYAGTSGNIPSGEAFVTPESVEGTFIGDVVVNIDRSYQLDEKNPLVIRCSGNEWRAVSGPRKILSALRVRMEEAHKGLLIQERNRSLPKAIINLKKKNFRNIGEFAINTNPRAELCDYLIVNEKIVGMIHLALGSGFDADRSTVYHYDIVINAPRQKLNSYAVDKQGKKRWIHKNGKLLF